MTDKEKKLFEKIPQKYRKHITNVKIELSDDHNIRGQRLYNYTLIYDNGDEVTFQNQGYMLYMLKEYSANGYYIGS